MKKILFIPMHPWYVENHIEYLIRYLGNEFFMEQAFCAFEPFEEGVKKDPLRRNPDDFDLIIPLRPTQGHTGVRDPSEYKHKIAFILWEPNEGRFKDSLINACTTPMAARSMKRAGHPYMFVHPGIDTRLFKPYPLLNKKSKKELVVGVIGCPHNPRHRVKDVVLPLLDIPGIEFRFFVRNWRNVGVDTEVAGGKEFHKRIYGGNKKWIGVPNVYNSIDVLLKVDFDPGLTFPILEAAACQVPFVATHVGIEDLFKDSGLIILPDEVDPDGNGREWYRKNIDEVIKRARAGLVFMRDNPDARERMGIHGRQKVLTYFNWENQIPKWRKFFNTALKMAEEAKK